MLEDFRHAQRREETLKDLLSDSAMKIIENSESMRLYFKEAILTGSLNQGTMIASMFKQNSKYTDYIINRDMDIDLMAILKYDIDDPTKCLQEIKGKPGHLKVSTDCVPPDVKSWQNFFALKDKYLRCFKVRNQFLQESTRKNYTVHRRGEFPKTQEKIQNDRIETFW